MNLAIDIGNSYAKLAVIDNGQIVDTLRTDNLSAKYIETVFKNHPDIEDAIMSSCRENNDEVTDTLKRLSKHFIHFDNSVTIPLKNLYQTPNTLGLDRLAAAVGANAIYPSNNIMVVDFGTAITIDMVSEHAEYLGGNISPGANTRFKALHHFTQKLPLCTLTEDISLTGKNSKEAIENGVINGIVYEIEGYIRDFSERYDNLKIIFTGGESNFFVKRLKNTIFANYDLVLYGLNRILEYNAQKQTIQ